MTKKTDTKRPLQSFKAFGIEASVWPPNGEYGETEQDKYPDPEFAERKCFPGFHHLQFPVNERLNVLVRAVAQPFVGAAEDYLSIPKHYHFRVYQTKFLTFSLVDDLTVVVDGRVL